jgi:hypothetical protein
VSANLKSYHHIASGHILIIHSMLLWMVQRGETETIPGRPMARTTAARTWAMGQGMSS